MERLTADDLDLYLGEPGTEEAASEISDALSVAVAAVLAEVGEDYTTTTRVAPIAAKVITKQVWPILERHNHVGAFDTEPRQIVNWTVAREVADYYDIPSNKMESLFYEIHGSL